MKSDGNREMERAHVLYSGRVQGVGFRYTATTIATRFNITGTIQNLPNGDVELIAEGDHSSLSDFLLQIRNSTLRDGIFQENINWEAPTGGFKQFGVSF